MKAKTLIVDGVAYNCPVLEKMGKDAFVERFKGGQERKGKSEEDALSYLESIFERAVPDSVKAETVETTVTAKKTKKSKATVTESETTDAATDSEVQAEE